MPVCSAASTTVPHCWHSPHRPTHLIVVHPHSVHRYGAVWVVRLVAITARLRGPSDIGRRRWRCQDPDASTAAPTTSWLNGTE